MQTVGEQRFQQLASTVSRYNYDPAKMTETTHGFFDVFAPDQTSLKTDRQLASRVRKDLGTESSRQELLPKDDFDFATLAKQLVSDGLAGDDIQANRELLITQHLMYGLDEPRLRQLVLQAVDWGTSNRIDPRQLKLVVAGSFTKPRSSAANTPQPAPAEDLSGLSAEEQQLIQVSQDLPPVTFLATLKKQTGGGYVTSSEKYIISNLLKQGLAPAVVNILSYDVIVQQDLPTLRKNLVDTIANSWQRSHISSASGALREIKTFNRPPKARKTASHYRHRKGRVKEQLPDWAQNKAGKKQTKASAAQLRESQQLLAKLKKKHENNNE